MAILLLAVRSLLNRRFTALLTVFSIALSVALLLGVEKVRTEARASFANTISGTDLIVGARSGPVNLLLYSVFRLGDPTNNISWESYQELAADRRVVWTIPLSLGDSHRGFRVLGTNHDYFQYYRYARDRSLQMAEGTRFEDLFDAVIGAEVAERLGYSVGDEIVIAHGAGKVSFSLHDDKPFQISGILARTGTPVDRTVHVSLEAIEAIHIDWQSGAPIPGQSISAEEVRDMDLTPKVITAALLGLQSKVLTFQLQREINTYPEEPLSAILPGVALAQLWGLVGNAENALLLISGFVVLVGLFGMLTALLTSLNERRREMAILRAMGARPGHVFALVMGEAGFLTFLGVLLGLALLYSGLVLAQPLIESEYGILIRINALTAWEWQLLGLVLASGFGVGAIPAWRAYRLSLTDGLTLRT